jgi:DNA-binding GntR family transcriptional regulator
MIQIRKSSLSEEVAAKLRQMISSSQLEPGAWIDEQGLASAMGVSRTPLREAIRLVAAEGLIRIEPRKGCFVNALSEKDLDDIFPLMAMLEGRCAFEAANRLTQADVNNLETLHQRLVTCSKLNTVDDYYVANRDIHEAIQKIAGNQWLSNMVDDLRRVLSLSRHKSLTLPGRIAESCAEHLAIFDALKKGNSSEADRLTRSHLLRQREVLKQLADSNAKELQA